MKSNFIGIMVTVLAILTLLLAGCAAPVSPGQANPATAPNVSPAVSTPPSTTQPSSSVTNPGANSSTNQAATTGKLEIKVTDAPSKDKITAILVTVKSIEVHKAGSGENTQATTSEPVQGTEQADNQNEVSGNWTTINLNQNKEFDLLKVKDNPDTLALAASEVGTYTQIRMEVASIKVTFQGSDGKEYIQQATVPSGKIKFIQPFKISSTEVTQLLFDFDAAQSVKVTGDDKVMFKPVIKVSVSKSSNEEKKASDLSITTDKLTDGKVGVQYQVTLNATGGTAPYKWGLTENKLPDGLSLNQDTGAITGTPTVAGDFHITIKVTDSSKPDAKNATKSFTIRITKPTA